MHCHPAHTLLHAAPVLLCKDYSSWLLFGHSWAQYSRFKDFLYNHTRLIGNYDVSPDRTFSLICISVFHLQTKPIVQEADEGVKICCCLNVDI